MSKELCVDYVDMVTNLLSKPNLHGIDNLTVLGTPESLDEEQFNEACNAAISNIESDLNLVHLALGIAGEALELSIATDEVNVLEELGDICFYTVGAAIHIRQQIVDDQLLVEQWLSNCIKFFLNGEKSFSNLFHNCDKAADYIKKKVFYRQKQLKTSTYPIEVSISSKLYDILKDINSIKPLPEVMQANMQKLGTRYQSGKFSTEEAAARKDKDA